MEVFKIQIIKTLIILSIYIVMWSTLLKTNRASNLQKVGSPVHERAQQNIGQHALYQKHC